MRKALILAAFTAAVTLALAPAASAIDKVNTKKLRQGVTVDGRSSSTSGRCRR